jgi:hypothetical protein
MKAFKVSFFLLVLVLGVYCDDDTKPLTGTVILPAGGTTGEFYRIFTVTGPALVTFDITVEGGSKAGTFTTLAIEDEGFTILSNNPKECSEEGKCYNVIGTYFKDISRASGTDVLFPEGIWQVIVINDNVLYSLSLDYSFKSEPYTSRAELVLYLSCCCLIVMAQCFYIYRLRNKIKRQLIIIQNGYQQADLLNEI